MVLWEGESAPLDHILSPSVPGFRDGAMLRAKGRKTVGKMGQTPKKGCPYPRAGQEDAQMLLG